MNAENAFCYGKTCLALWRDNWGGSYLRRTGSRALCSDGKVRSLAHLAQQADTHYSIPAAVRIDGQYVKGYVTTDENEAGERAVTFRRLHEYKEWLPDFPDKYTLEHEILMRKAHV